MGVFNLQTCIFGPLAGGKDGKSIACPGAWYAMRLRCACHEASAG
jgi:hypothetical protein